MKTVILAGGLGTRLREETEYIPKPMVEVGDKPILWHIMKTYEHYGHNDFILCLGYKQEMIREYFKNFYIYNRDIKIDLGKNGDIEFLDKNNEYEWKITMADTGLMSNTGERVLNIKKYINNKESFLLTYGDGLGDVEINNLIDFHNSHDGSITISTTKPVSRFGLIEKDKNNLVTKFNEKNEENVNINCGFMVLDYSVFDFIKEGDIFEVDTLPRLVKSKELYSFEHTGYFQPMDTYREYIELNKLWNSGEAPWKVWN